MFIIPSDSASIYSVLTAAQNLTLVRPSNPPPGLAGFLFDIDGDQIFRLRSDISKHFIEDNTTIQDQIALSPEEVILRGYVAELVLGALPSSKAVSQTPSPLPLNQALMPAFTPGTIQAQINLAQVSAFAPNVNSLWGKYISSGTASGQSRQSIVFNYFYQLWLGRELFTIETPWGTMLNMAILSLDAEQPEETNSRTDFSITFQKIRIAQQNSVTPGLVYGRANGSQPTIQNGVVPTAPSSLSLSQAQQAFANPPVP
jgi:hypothetical protein